MIERPSYSGQRFYSSQFGRFWSADRFQQAAKVNDCGSWNKYSYTRNDPVNRVDPDGTDDCDPNYCVTIVDSPDPLGGGDGQKGNPKNQGNDPTTKSPGILHVTGITKSGANYDAAKTKLQQLEKNLDPECQKFLNNNTYGDTAQSYIDSILGSDLLAVGTFTPSIAAFTGTGGTDVPAGTAAILVNNNSAFYNSSYTVDNGMYTGGTAQAQVEILLHELGHAGVVGFQSDYGNAKAGQANDNLVNQNCAKTIKGAGSWGN